MRLRSLIPSKTRGGCAQAQGGAARDIYRWEQEDRPQAESVVMVICYLPVRVLDDHAFCLFGAAEAQISIDRPLDQP